jgi:hypothetical protein
MYFWVFSYALAAFHRIGEVGIWAYISHPIALAIVWVPVLWIADATRSGKNWGRIVIAGFTIFGFFDKLWFHLPDPAPKMVLLQISQGTLYVISSVLLFLPESNRWFRSIKLSQPPTEQ